MEHVLVLVHLHGVAQGAGSAGDDGDLVDRGGIFLLGGHQGVADFVAGDHPLLLGRHHQALALAAGDHRIHRRLQVLLQHRRMAHAHRPQGGFVDDVGQVRAGSAHRGLGDGGIVHVLAHVDGPSVYF